MIIYPKSLAWERPQDFSTPLPTLIPNYNPDASEDSRARWWRVGASLGFTAATVFTNNAIGGELVLTLPESLSIDTDALGITGSGS